MGPEKALRERQLQIFYNHKRELVASLAWKWAKVYILNLQVALLSTYFWRGVRG